MARPSHAVKENHQTSRDAGLAESGFALPFRLYRPTFSACFALSGRATIVLPVSKATVSRMGTRRACFHPHRPDGFVSCDSLFRNV